MKNYKEKILSDYNKNKHTLEACTKKFELLLIELLKSKNIRFHQITKRTKEYESLIEKIEQKNDKYKQLSDITDIIGTRIITYLDSEVDLVAQIIEDEFEIDRENSIDKRKLATNEFGYKSLHYVVSFKATRADLPEYKSYKDYKCEIQVRSILQHAWAEIEHDLGY